MVTIEQCQQWARENYPLVRQFGLVEHAREYNLANASRNYLPQLSFEGKASWQSEALKIPLEIPSQVMVKVPQDVPGMGGKEIPVELPGVKLPESSQDQYVATLKATQVLWDGGRIGAAKKAIRAEADVALEGIETKLYELRSKINDLFFGVLLIDGRLAQLTLADSTLAEVYQRVNTALLNGMANPSDLDAVEVEQLKYKQQRVELESRRTAYLDVLAAFIHRPLKTSMVLKRPDESGTFFKGDSIYRPELRYLNRKKDRLSAEYAMTLAENRPKLGLFAVGGYGNPGLNLLSDRFSSFFLGGVSLTWNFGTWYTLKNDKRIIQTKREGVDVECESFLFNTRMELIQNDAEMKRLRRLIVDDEKIVCLRENIKNASVVKYENGVCTMAELIGDIHAESIARQEKLVREIEYLMTLYARGIIMGQ